MKNVVNDDVKNVAVVYARYSSRGQTEQSIEGQVAAARAYAEAKGYTIIREYADRAKTGTNDDREAFQTMLADTAKHQFGVVLVWKVDRFGRNREEIAYNKYRCKKNDVRVEYVAENLPDGPEAVILESVFEGMAEYFSLQLSQNVKRGIRESAKKHQVIGGHVPLGYRAGPDKKYEIVPEEAQVVREAFEMYADGMAMSELIRIMNGRGYTRKDGQLFGKNSFYYIFKNPRYKGTYIYKGEETPGAVPPIVSEELWDQVQRRMGANKRMPSHNWSYSDYLLTGKLFCGHCGSPMVGESGFGKLGKKYSYYICRKRRTKKDCDKTPVRQDWIEQVVLGYTRALLRDDDLLEYIADQTYQYYLKNDSTRKSIEAAEKQLQTVQTAQMNLVQVLELGVVNDTLTARLSALSEQEKALRKAISELRLDAAIEISKDHILYFLYKLRDLDLDSRPSQRRLVEIFISGIFVYDDKLKLTFHFGEDDRVVSLRELEESGDVFVSCSLSPAFVITYKPGVWVVTIKIPES